MRSAIIITAALLLGGCASYDQARGSYESSRAEAFCDGLGFKRGSMEHSQCVIEMVAAREARR